VDKIRFYVGGVEDVLGRGMIKVDEGSSVGVLSWLWMDSRCYFLGVGWRSSSLRSSLGICWTRTSILLLIDGSLDLD
jgi:hypothetical protein